MSVGKNFKGFYDRDGVKHAIPTEGGGGVDPSIIERLNEKTDKVNPELEGHLAVYDEDGNLMDGGEKSQFASGIKLYEDSSASFEDSGILGTILSVGIHQILYIPTTNNPSTYHILLVRYFSMKPSPMSSIKKAVEQCLIDDKGIKTRLRLFNDDEHTDPYNSWSDWKVLTPEVGNYITEDSSLPVTSAAIYTALAGKANVSDLAGKFENIVTGENDTIAFDVSSNVLVLKSDTTIYAPLFRDAIYTFPVEIGVYDSDNDVYIPFIGFCKTGYDAYNGVYHSKVFIGERVLVLSKVAATGVTTLDSTYTLGSLLS